MPNLYKNESSNQKTNAQRNLCGRTHYVDDDTLKFHKSRVISARHAADGLLFAIVTSDAQDFENLSRGFRYVIFDVFGAVVERNGKDSVAAVGDPKFFRTSNQATAALWKAIDAIDAPVITRAAIEREAINQQNDLARLSSAICEIEYAARAKAEKIA